MWKTTSVWAPRHELRRRCCPRPPRSREHRRRCRPVRGDGRLALEAHGRARPVVASAVGGLPEVVDDGETGVLVPPDDPATWPMRSSRCSRTPNAPCHGPAGQGAHASAVPSDEFERGYRAAGFVGVAMTHVLFVTQVIDEDDPTLGFVTSWIDALAERAGRRHRDRNEVRGTPRSRPTSGWCRSGRSAAPAGSARGRAPARRGDLGRASSGPVGAHVPDLPRHHRAGHRLAPDAHDAVVRAPVGDTGAAARGAPQRRRADLPAGGLSAAGPEGSRGGPGHGHGADRVRPAGRARSGCAPAGGDRPTSPSKGFDRAIRALAKARAEGVEATLRIVGPSTTEQERAHAVELRDLATATGLGRRDLRAGVTPKQVDGVVRSADVLVNGMVAGSGTRWCSRRWRRNRAAGRQPGVPAVAVRPVRSTSRSTGTTKPCSPSAS